MFIIHRINMTIRRLTQELYYKVIFGNKVSFGANFRSRGRFNLFIDKTGSVIFGKNIFLNNDFSANSQSKIEIGDNCILGENVKMYDHNHVFANKNISISKQGFNSAPIKIGKDCWIGSNVTILKGVQIGSNCVIGANCLIYKDIPSNSVVKLKEQLIISERK